MIANQADLEIRWFIKVVDQNRIRIPGVVSESAFWLRKKESVNVCVAIGGAMQLIVFPGSERRTLIREALNAVEGSAFSHATSSDRSTEALRDLAALWPATMSFELAGDRFSFTFPADLRELKLCATKEQYAVVLALGSFIEIWRAEEWMTHRANRGVLGLDEISSLIGDVKPD